MSFGRYGSVWIMYLLPLLTVTWIGVSAYLTFSSKTELTVHVGSATCADCHRAIFSGWQDSLHPKMMRRVTEPGVLVADLSLDHPDITFDPAQAVWAIGSKWEQQFMGEDETGETLLPGAWLVGQGKWKTTGWDGWQVPIPLRRCHGCHTVGLDVETGHFVEPGIGCESCHGPGGWHNETEGFGEIHASLDAQICGSCHSRGRSSDGAYFFPVGYLPGDELGALFTEQQPDYIQNSSAWWGNGSERKRHQEYTAWRLGGHADSLKHLKEGYDERYGELTGDCLRCHSAEAAVYPVETGGLTIDAVEHGITCAVCHNVHGRLNEPRLGCADCHESGAFYHQPERNQEHVPCPDEANVGCVDCHMPLTGKNGGAYQVHSHRPGVVLPTATIQFGVPSSCSNGNCHREIDPAKLQLIFDRHYRIGL